MTVYLTAAGQSLNLSTTLGKGGEGTVYNIDAHPEIAAKIYSPNALDREREIKINAMIAAGLHSQVTFAAFPIETIKTKSGSFVGFTMRKVPGRHPVHQLYSPTGRKSSFPKSSYPMLVRAAANTARAVAAIHAAKCVIGDINHSGVLVSDDATVVLIDSDSFQFTFQNQLFACKVGVPEFTPPELQGHTLSKTVRTSNHDGFGLAVLIFYTLMMGRHPFAGRFLGRGDMPMERAIAEYRFAYSARRQETQTEPPPNVPILSDLPNYLASGFERAFGPHSAQTGRPAAAEWVDLLTKAETEIIACSANQGHHYFKAAPNCPWCRMERAFPGFQAFVPVFSSIDRAFNLGELIAAVQKLRDPGPAPALSSLMSTISVDAYDAQAEQIRRDRIRRWAVGILSLTVSSCLFLFSPPVGPFGGLAVAAGGMTIALRQTSTQQKQRRKLQEANRRWNEAQSSYEKAAGNEYFGHLRRQADELIYRIKELESERARRITEVERKREETQRRQYLEKYYIKDARIKLLGMGRKVTLTSYGIETAADVDHRRIVAISGFGNKIAGELVGWRRSIERNFRFDPNRGVNPADLAVIHGDVNQRRDKLRSQLEQNLAAMKSASAASAAARAKPSPEALSAWTELAEAKQAEQARSFTATQSALLFTLAFGGLVAFLGVKSATSEHGSGAPIGAVLSSASQKSTPLQTDDPGPPNEAKTASSVSREGSAKPSLAQPTLSSSPASFATPQTSLPQGSPIVAAPVATPSPTASPGSMPPQGATPAPTQKQGGNPQATSSTPSPPDLLKPSEAIQVQARLKALGYFSGTPDGVWGVKSRVALRQFRRNQGLGGNDKWDAATEAALVSRDAITAAASPRIAADPDDWRFPGYGGASRNPLNKDDATWIQTQLLSLGYFKNQVDGIWGPAARASVRAFRWASGLSNDEAWDVETEAKLGASTVAASKASFTGRWAEHPEDCPTDGGAAPVVITTQSAQAYGGNCEFEEIVPVGSGWRVHGLCTYQGQTWSSDINLAVSAGKLTWSSQKGVVTYFRCPG